jgi:hypothetical protein
MAKGDYPQAVRRYQDTIDSAADADWLQAAASIGLGEICLISGDTAQARQHLGTAAEIVAQARSMPNMLDFLLADARLAERLDEAQSAAESQPAPTDQPEGMTSPQRAQTIVDYLASHLPPGVVAAALERAQARIPE